MRDFATNMLASQQIHRNLCHIILASRKLTGKALSMSRRCRMILWDGPKVLPRQMCGNSEYAICPAAPVTHILRGRLIFLVLFGVGSKACAAPKELGLTTKKKQMSESEWWAIFEGFKRKKHTAAALFPARRGRFLRDHRNRK
jgi:hypothetical protein